MELIVINCLSALRGGGQTYLINILEHFPIGDYKILLLTNTENNAIFTRFRSKNVDIYEATWASKNIIRRTLWEIFVLPVKLKQFNAKVYFAPGGLMTTLTPKNCISATALRNMLPFDDRERKRFKFFSYIRFRLWILRYAFLMSYRFSNKIIFISEYSRSVIQKYMPDIGEKSIVVPHGLNRFFLNKDTTYNLPDFLSASQFYLYVSILDVYKAQKEVIKSWKLLVDDDFPYPLVLVGPKYSQYGEEVVALIEQLELRGKVIYLGAVDYHQLPGLYKSARALIFASSCECCPNILLEKLAAGRPVLCSDIQPMPEFGSDAVVYFDPYNINDLSDKVQALEDHPEIMENLSTKAYNQALKFDWKSTTKKTIEFLVNKN